MKLPFLGKKEKPGKVPSSERVRALSAQGLSEPEIIRTLRTEGYSPSDVDKAMKEAIKTAVAPRREAPAPARRFEEELPPMGPEPREPEELPPPPGGDEFELAEFPRGRFPEEEPARAPAAAWRPPGEELPPLPRIERPGAAPAGMSRSEIEEIVEGTLEERMRSFDIRLADMNSKVEGLTSRLSAIEANLGQIKGVKASEVEGLMTNIQAYKESIGELSGRIEAMEHAVKDSLTPMMQSLRSLSDTIKALKTKGK